MGTLLIKDAELVVTMDDTDTRIAGGGRVRVRNGQLADVGFPPLVERHNAIARALVRGTRI